MQKILVHTEVIEKVKSSTVRDVLEGVYFDFVPKNISKYCKEKGIKLEVVVFDNLYTQSTSLEFYAHCQEETATWLSIIGGSK